MITNRTSELVLLGTLGGFLAAFLFISNDRSAQAQPAAAATVGRYQLSAWGSDRGGHGAFIVDTQTGDMFNEDTAGNVRKGVSVPAAK